MARTLSLALLAALAAPLHAQSAPPSTDIYLAPLHASAAGVMVGEPVNLTSRDGYDNQPSFTPDGRAILYTSVRDSQADIWRYDLRRRTTTRLTATPESEYSPTVMPGGRRFSVVRVERDSTQRLWSFALDGSDPRIVLSDVKPVGYHAWGDDTTLVLFVLGRPATLQLASTATGKAVTVAPDVGRSIAKVPGRKAVSFVLRPPADSTWWLHLLWLWPSPGHWEAQRVARMLPNSDYVAWLRDGRAIAGAGTKLYVLDAKAGSEWREIADLAAAKLDRISRLAISPDGRWLALVAEPRP